MAAAHAQPVPTEGLVPDLVPASEGGDQVDTGDGVFLLVVTGAQPCELTIVTPGAAAGIDLDDTVVTIPAGTTTPPMVVPLPTALYGDPEGQCTLRWSITSDIQYAAVQR